ncbi:MAG: hypothetical protein ACHQ01_01785 [Candidatus Limnocylindrales bacterium]
MRRLVVAGAILATLLTAPLSLAAATPALSTAPTDSERATAALEYLLAAQHSDGSIDASLGETADFVIGAAAAGYDPATLQGCAAGTSALSYLAAASDTAAADPAKTGKAILAVVASGGNPGSFAGRDLTARLAAVYQSTTGAYGDGSTFGQSFAILALVASGGAVPMVATGELAALQDPDGSWSYGAAPVAAGLGDTNSTAIAMMALDAAGVHAADAAGLTYLHTQQLADGGFPYQNSSTYGPPASDPDSDSIVLQALIAAGQDPESASWSRGGNDVLTNLRAGQGADGGFAYPGSGEDAFTTSQVPAALMRDPYAVAVHPKAGNALPTSACPSPSSSSSPVASPSPASTPTRAPTPRPTIRPKAAPTPAPTSIPTDTPTLSPTEPPTASPTIALAATADTATAVVGAETALPSGEPGGPGGASGYGGVPAPVVYALAALAGLAVVVGGGWLIASRAGKP